MFWWEMFRFSIGANLDEKKKEEMMRSVQQSIIYIQWNILFTTRRYFFMETDRSTFYSKNRFAERNGS